MMTTDRYETFCGLVDKQGWHLELDHRQGPMRGQIWSLRVVNENSPRAAYQEIQALALIHVLDDLVTAVSAEILAMRWVIPASGGVDGEDHALPDEELPLL